MRTLLLSLLEIVCRYILASGMRFNENYFGDKLFQVVNPIRQRRFNVPTRECDDCGYLFPRDDLRLSPKSDGREYWVCTECGDFEVWWAALAEAVA